MFNVILVCFVSRFSHQCLDILLESFREVGAADVIGVGWPRDSCLSSIDPKCRSLDPVKRKISTGVHEAARCGYTDLGRVSSVCLCCR